VKDAKDPPPTLLEVIEDDNWLWEPGEIKVVPLGRPATIADLRRTKLKAEIVNGELLVIGPSGGWAATAAGNIIFSLHLYEREFGGGETMMSRVAFIIDLPHRQSVCPDVSWFTGPGPTPAFHAARPCSPGDTGRHRLRRRSRATLRRQARGLLRGGDAGGLGCRRAARALDPRVSRRRAGPSRRLRRGEIAEAEPAVPGWRFTVKDLFRAGKQRPA
jgi:hypothetical protein